MDPKARRAELERSLRGRALRLVGFRLIAVIDELDRDARFGFNITASHFEWQYRPFIRRGDQVRLNAEGRAS